MQIISSKDNNLIKHIKKLKEKKYREEYNEFLIEGIKMLKEAIDEHAKIKKIIYSDSFIKNNDITEFKNENISQDDMFCIPDNIFKIVTDVGTPQGVLAIIGKNKKIDIDAVNEEFLIALDDLQDPGNLGTILRTADSANIKNILVSKGTVDCYSSKVIRSTMGAIFRCNVIECENLKKSLEILKNKGYNIITTALDAKETIYNINYNKSIVIIGNEANGVSKEIQNISNTKVIIPMLGKTESLNAAVATGVIIYEYVRKKIKI